MSTIAITPPKLDTLHNTRLGDGVAVLGRLLIATIFVLSGASKVAAPAATISMIQSAGLPFATLGLAISVAVEIGGGLALILGYHTRLAGLALFAFTLATALAFHSNFADQNQFIDFLKNIAMAGGLLQIVAFGGGCYSLDARNA